MDKHQVGIAIQHITDTYERSIRLQSAAEPVQGASDQPAHEEEEEEDPLEILLKRRDSGQTTDHVERQSSTILTDITALQYQKRLDKKTDVYKYWNQHPNKDLGSLCNTVISLPVTQVSVERTFSGLNYILNDLRFKMKDDIIDSIMVLRTNV